MLPLRNRAILRRAWVASALTFAFAAPAAAERRGAIAFHYASPLSSAELAWYSRFDVLVTHDPLPRAQVDYLHSRGTRLVLYEWSVAFYASLAAESSWQRTLIAGRSPLLLNHDALRGHAGSETSDAYYFDPAAMDHETERARQLAHKLRSVGYDGAFFDTTTADSVHPAALEEFKKRHPTVDYDTAFVRFLRNLRSEMRRGLIVTNQSYRKSDLYYPHVDWDITESFMTHPRSGRFVFRPWNDPGDPWNSIAFIVRKLIEPGRRKFPRVRLAHLNYLDAPDADSIVAIIAMARLFDTEAFVTGTEIAGEATSLDSPAYFTDIGAPSGSVIETRRSAYRRYRRGLIAVNASSEMLLVPNPRRQTFVDAVTGEKTSARMLTVPAAKTGIRAVVFKRVGR